MRPLPLTLQQRHDRDAAGYPAVRVHTELTRCRINVRPPVPGVNRRRMSPQYGTHTHTHTHTPIIANCVYWGLTPYTIEADDDCWCVCVCVCVCVN